MTVENPTHGERMPGSDLTVRQHAVLGFIRKCYVEDNRGPTIRGISAFVGSSNPSSVSYNLSVLEAKGYITLSHDNLSRGIRLVVDPVRDREKALVRAAQDIFIAGEKHPEDALDSLADALDAYKGFTT